MTLPQLQVMETLAYTYMISIWMVKKLESQNELLQDKNMTL
jgi:hypothetical protein